MYHHLWTNAPKECYELPEYTFKDHFGKAIPSFPPREVYYDYISGRAKKNNADELIRYNTPVKNVSYCDDSEKFTLKAFDYSKNEQVESEYDHVIVANGHFSVPSLPYYPGFDNYQGRVMHSHDFKNAEEVAG